MVYTSHDQLSRSEFYNNVSAKDRVQLFNHNQIRLQVNDTNKEVQKVRTNFEPADDTDLINKAYFDKKLPAIERPISYREEDFNRLSLLSNKQSVEEILFLLHD